MGVLHSMIPSSMGRNAFVDAEFSGYAFGRVDTLWASVDFHLVLRVSMCYE
jgi:hypothetical protein